MHTSLTSVVAVTVLLLSSCGESSSSMPLQAGLIDTFSGTWSVMGNDVAGDKSVVVKDEPDGTAFYLGAKQCRILFTKTSDTNAVLSQSSSSMGWLCELQGKQVNISMASAEATITTSRHSSCSSSTKNRLNLTLNTAQGVLNYWGAGRSEINDYCPEKCPGKICF